MKVLVAAGASGGHVYPGLATAVVLRDRGHEVVFAGGDRLETRVVPQAGFDFHPLPVQRPPSVRKELLTPRGVRALGSIAAATIRARSLVRRLAPDTILSMGGFASVPVALAGAFSRARLVLHEQNAHLSLAQRIPLRRSDVLAMGLPIEEDVAHPRTVLVGNPVRASIAALGGLGHDDRSRMRPDARRRLGLHPDRPTVVAIGGSLGAGPINDALPAIWTAVSARMPDAQLFHACGTAHEDAVRAAWGGRDGVVVAGFVETMEDLYLAADVALSRSGAITVAELAIAGVPTIFVPLLTLARGDQDANARVAQRAGAAEVVQQSDPDFSATAASRLLEILGDGDRRVRMTEAARTVARPDAADRLADVVEGSASFHASPPARP